MTIYRKLSLLEVDSMSIYAISPIKKNNNLVGIRLFSEDNGSVVNSRIEQVIQYIRDGKDIRNLGLKNGKLEWTQGAMDRYPVLDADTLQILDNKNSLIVLGYRDDEELGNNLRIYSVANYLGQVVELDEKKLVQYADQYQLANCKLVPKTGPVRHLVSLGGELKYMSSEVTWEYDNYYRELVIRLPEAKITKLTIPDRVKGNKVLYPYNAVVIPSTKAKNITHIKMSNGIERLTGNLFKAFTRLRSLDIDCNIEYISDSLQDNYCLEEVRIKHLNHGTIPSSFFRDLVNLKKVTIGNTLKRIGHSAFRGCKNLDLTSVLKEGLIEIGNSAFADCGMTELVIPSTVSDLDITAFDNCKNLKKVLFKGNKLKITSNKYNEKDKNTLMFSGCGQVDVYVPYGTNLREHLGPNVTIHESEPTAGDLKAERIEKKATILGVDVSAHEIAKTPSEVLGILTSITEADWKKIVNEILVDAKNNVTKNVVRGVDGLMFENKSLLSCRSDIKKVQVSNDFALIWENRLLKVVFINREVCKKALEEVISHYKIYYRNYNINNYAYSLPVKNIYNSSTNPVKNIEIISPESFKVIRKYGKGVEEIYTIHDTRRYY